MIVGIKDNLVITIFDAYDSLEDILQLPEGITAEYAPEYVKPGWTYSDGKYVAPVQPGWEYDYQDLKYYPHEKYRRILHNRTSDDTLEAYRKLRQNDQTIDWQSWLNELDAYNVAIEETKKQETYPDKVIYPEYPIKPKVESESDSEPQP